MAAQRGKQTNTNNKQQAQTNNQQIQQLMNQLKNNNSMNTAMQNANMGNNNQNPNMNCTLVVPANPLTAQGLATPFRLKATNAADGACNESVKKQAAFVEAGILDPATGQMFVYNPLVADMGTQPLAPPVVPNLPNNAVVALWFGFNGDQLTLQGTNGSLTDGNCVNGLPGSIFGQFAYCNAPAFFDAAQTAIDAGKMKLPELGMGMDGMECPTVRDFTMVDMDQSDNVVSAYLVQGNATAQATAQNMAAMPNATVLTNASDNGLLDNFIDKAIGCTPASAPNLGNNMAPSPSQALNELIAAQFQTDPIALVPPNDPMVQNNKNMSLVKTNLYRAGVGQPQLKTIGTTPTDYCQNYVDVALPRIQQDRMMTSIIASPDPAAGTTLFTFLAQRAAGTFDALGCMNLLNMPNPVTLTKNGDVTTDAKFADQVPAIKPATMPQLVNGVTNTAMTTGTQMNTAAGNAGIGTAGAGTAGAGNAGAGTAGAGNAGAAKTGVANLNQVAGTAGATGGVGAANTDNTNADNTANVAMQRAGPANTNANAGVNALIAANRIVNTENQNGAGVPAAPLAAQAAGGGGNITDGATGNAGGNVANNGAAAGGNGGLLAGNNANTGDNAGTAGTAGAAGGAGNIAAGNGVAKTENFTAAGLIRATGVNADGAPGSKGAGMMQTLAIGLGILGFGMALLWLTLQVQERRRLAFVRTWENNNYRDKDDWGWR